MSPEIRRAWAVAAAFVLFSAAPVRAEATDFPSFRRDALRAMAFQMREAGLSVEPDASMADQLEALFQAGRDVSPTDAPSPVRLGVGVSSMTRGGSTTHSNYTSVLVTRSLEELWGPIARGEIGVNVAFMPTEGIAKLEGGWNWRSQQKVFMVGDLHLNEVSLSVYRLGQDGVFARGRYERYPVERTILGRLRAVGDAHVAKIVFDGGGRFYTQILRAFHFREPELVTASEAPEG